MEERILNKVKELLFPFGIRSVTMDDIAKQMGVSKKTIYQFYSDKNQIVEKVIRDLVTSQVQLRSVQNLQYFPADQFNYQTLLSQLTELFLHGITSQPVSSRYQNI